jgi:hypothetical protein
MVTILLEVNMSTKRISLDIALDIQKMDKFLRAIDTNRSQYKKFTENPAEVLREYGISIQDYGSKDLAFDVIANDIAVIVERVVEDSIKADIVSIWESVMETSYRSSTHSSYEYNFDNSSQTDYKYESHTGTERGTFSETSTGEAIDTDTRFNGFSFEEFQSKFAGPLISDAALNIILTETRKTLAIAKEKYH